MVLGAVNDCTARQTDQHALTGDKTPLRDTSYCRQHITDTEWLDSTSQLHSSLFNANPHKVHLTRTTTHHFTALDPGQFRWASTRSNIRSSTP